MSKRKQTTDPKIQMRKDIALSFVYKNQGDWMKTYANFEAGKSPDQNDIQEAYDWLNKYNLDFIYLENQEYPEEYKGKYYKPPFVIFVDSDGNHILDTEMNFATGQKRSE